MDDMDNFVDTVGNGLRMLFAIPLFVVLIAISPIIGVLWLLGRLGKLVGVD